MLDGSVSIHEALGSGNQHPRSQAWWHVPATIALWVVEARGADILAHPYRVSFEVTLD